jgi:hypothetical protein
LLVTASLPFGTGSAPICPMLNARIVHETAIPEPSRTHQLRPLPRRGAPSPLPAVISSLRPPAGSPTSARPLAVTASCS